MRMWMIDPRLMCRQHLLGEHNEIHKLVGTIRKRISLYGYIKNRLVDLNHLQSRHDVLALEIQRRGWNHKSVLPYVPFLPLETVFVEESLFELGKRCGECRRRILSAYGEVTINGDLL